MAIAYDRKNMDDRLVVGNLLKLHDMICVKNMLNFYEKRMDSFEEALDMFIRLNSYGTPLSKTVLLYLMLISRWKGAKNEMKELLNDINNMDGGFNFTDDFILKVCLCLTDFDTDLKAEAFDVERVGKIR